MVPHSRGNQMSVSSRLQGDSRTTRTTQKNPVSKTKEKKQQQQKHFKKWLGMGGTSTGRKTELGV